MTLEHLLSALEREGVKLSLILTRGEPDRIRYAPTPSPALLEAMREHKESLIEHLSYPKAICTECGEEVVPGQNIYGWLAAEGGIRYYHRDTCLPPDKKYIPLQMAGKEPVKGTGCVVAVDQTELIL